MTTNSMKYLVNWIALNTHVRFENTQPCLKFGGTGKSGSCTSPALVFWARGTWQVLSIQLDKSSYLSTSVGPWENSNTLLLHWFQKIRQILLWNETYVTLGKAAAILGLNDTLRDQCQKRDANSFFISLDFALTVGHIWTHFIMTHTFKRKSIRSLNDADAGRRTVFMRPWFWICLFVCLLE